MELLTTAYDPDATEAPAAAYSEYDQYYDLYATPSAAPAGADDQGLYATPTAAPAAGRRRLDDGYDVYYGEGYCSDANGVGLEHSVYGYSSAEECGSLCIDYGSTNGIDFGPIFVRRATEVTRELGTFLGLQLNDVLQPEEPPALGH